MLGVWDAVFELPVMARQTPLNGRARLREALTPRRRDMTATLDRDAMPPLIAL